ncbi:MAG: hypothetical protein Q9210_005831 [Variospora velana]
MLASGVFTSMSLALWFLAQVGLAAPSWSTRAQLQHRAGEARPRPLVIRSVICDKTWHGFRGVEKIFSFGDSYTDSGFNPDGALPNDAHPLGNPPTDSSTPPFHTFTNGPNWIQYLTSKYNESQIKTYNLAMTGSTVNNTILGILHENDLVHQISDRFAPNYANQEMVGWTSSNALFSLFFGINDVNHSWDKQDRKINEAVVSNYLTLLDSLYKYGARSFLLHTVPPIDRGTKPTEARAVNDFNYGMTRLFASFTSKHNDLSVLLFDTHSVFSQAMAQPGIWPQTANLKDTTGSCEVYEDGDVSSMDYYDLRSTSSSSSTDLIRINSKPLSGSHSFFPSLVTIMSASVDESFPFLKLTRELRDSVYESLLLSSRVPPESPEHSGARKYPSDEDQDCFEYCNHYPADGLKSTDASLLLTCRQICEEVKEAMVRLSKSNYSLYKLDLMLLDERELYVTWLAYPHSTTKIPRLDVDFRLFGDVEGKETTLKIGDGGPPILTWGLFTLIERFLQRGPDFLAPRKQGRDLWIEELSVNVLTPPSPPPGGYANFFNLVYGNIAAKNQAHGVLFSPCIREDKADDL